LFWQQHKFSASSCHTRRRAQEPSSFKDPRPAEFTFEQLEAVTKGFGTVYGAGSPTSARWPSSATICGPRARRFQEKESAFRSELAFLPRLDHKRPRRPGWATAKENEERLLVYEY